MRHRCFVCTLNNQVVLSAAPSPSCLTESRLYSAKYSVSNRFDNGSLATRLSRLVCAGT